MRFAKLNYMTFFISFHEHLEHNLNVGMEMYTCLTIILYAPPLELLFTQKWKVSNR